MPVIRRAPIRPALILCLGVASLAGGPSAMARDAGAPGIDIGLGGPSLVPLIPGAPYPRTLGSPRRGFIGRPRWFGRLHIEMDVEPACAIHAAFGEEVVVHCSRNIPFLAGLTSDADPDFEGTLAFTPGPDARASLSNDVLVQIHAQRLTVDY